ncbi:MAG TPA: hypothetical protein VHJ78_09125 [Actinomycetota bacterium]|nr:hypothetical protein [Actinomycetota bacterium]
MERLRLLAVLLAVGVVGVVVALAPQESSQQALSPPSSIPSDCSRTVDAELNEFFASVQEGADVEFRSDACYALRNPVRIERKRSVRIDGNGATLRNSAPNDGRINSPNIMLIKARDVTIENLNLVGNFNLTGPRSQEKVNQSSVEQPSNGTQFNSGLSIYGGRGVRIQDVTARNVFGDGLTTAVSEYVDNTPPFEAPRDIRVSRFRAISTARHCFAPTSAIGFWLEDSLGQDCWYSGVDAELDEVEHYLQDVHLLRNTFDGFFSVGIAFPVAGSGDNTRDYEIRDNDLRTIPDASPCNPVILINAYPESNPNTTKNVVIEGNSVKAWGSAIVVDHVDGGSIRENKIERSPPAGTTSEMQCSPSGAEPVRVTNSSGVEVAANQCCRPQPTAAPSRLGG